MKKIFNIVLLFIITVSLFCFLNVPTKAIYDIDRIDYYEIKIDSRKDATLDMKFKIIWTVLDSKIEGPLEWIKIGIPNYHVDEIQGLTNNIKDIYYYSEGGAYVRIDLDKPYYEGETLTIEFSIHQSRMYKFNDKHCYYNYRAGWFDEIKVTKAVILWNSENVIDHDATSMDGEYLRWDNSLDYSEKIEANVVYSKNNFINLNKDGIYTEEYMTPAEKRTMIIVIAIIVAIVVTIVIIARVTSDPYMGSRGFYSRRFGWYRPHHHSGVRHGGGGSSCACACACACAGGGRAGCSKKDFYNPNVKISQIQDYLKK